MGNKRFRFGTERRWLTILVLAVLVPLAAFQALHVRDQRQTQSEHQQALLGRIALAVSDRLDLELTTASRLLATLAEVPQLGTPGHPACSTILADMLPTQPHYTNLSQVDETGHIVCSSSPLPAPVDVRRSRNIRAAFETGAVGVSDFKRGLLTKRPVLVLSHPLPGADGTVTGTLNIGLSLDWLQEHLQRRTLPDGATVTVTSRSGLVLASSDPSHPPGSLLPPEALAPTLALLRGGALPTTAPATAMSDGTIRAVTAVGELPSGAVVVVERPEAVAMADIDDMARLWFAAFAGLAVASLGAVYMTVDRLMLRRLDRLSATARSFAQGKYDRRADVWRDDSGLSSLARDMDAMAGELATRERSLREALDDMTRARAETARFAYIAAHDLQEPLRAIGGFTRLLDKRLGDATDPDVRHYMDRIVGAAERMRLMFKELMDYAVMDAGERLRRPVDLDAVVAEVAGAFPHASVSRAGLPVVAGNPGQLRQLVRNLLDNAVTYAGADGRHPDVAVSAQRQGDVWEIAVRDNGPGIPAEDRETVFHLFKKLHARETHPRTGPGTGLPIARRIAELHGGRMWVVPRTDQEDVDIGCDVRFTLSATEPDPTPEAGEAAPAGSASVPSRKGAAA